LCQTPVAQSETKPINLVVVDEASLAELDEPAEQVMAYNIVNLLANLSAISDAKKTNVMTLGMAAEIEEEIDRAIGKLVRLIRIRAINIIESTQAMFRALAETERSM